MADEVYSPPPPRASVVAKVTLTVLGGAIPLALAGWVHTAERIATLEEKTTNNKETFQTGLKDLKDELHQDVLMVTGALTELKGNEPRGRK